PCFFFSSRRRHTRWPRDWSSDVCSSDLVGARKGKPSPTSAKVSDAARSQSIIWSCTLITPPSTSARAAPALPERERERRRQNDRSEERRVGKEWRAGGWRYR